MKLNLDKIPILGTKFWKELGGKIPGLIKADALQGIMQNDTKGHRYKSKQYVRYKQNRMERFTTTKTGNKGTKISPYKAVSIESNNVAFVDLTLTGQMLNGLAVKSSDDNGVVLSYAQKDAGKVLGNKRLGYNVLGLNDKNKDYVRNQIISELKRRQEKLIPKKIEIFIG